MEDQEAISENRKPITNGIIYSLVVAASCYIQIKQSQRWELPMRDFVTACKILKSGKTRKVVDLAKKWNPNFSTDGGKN